MTPVVAYTDGSWFPTPAGPIGVAAFTVIDADGVILAQEMVPPFSAANVTIAELAGIRAAMDWLLENDHRSACIRTDALPIVLALVNSTTFGGATRPAWLAVTRWISSFDRIDIEFVPRTTPAIQVCDHLCWLARQHLSAQVVAACA